MKFELKKYKKLYKETGKYVSGSAWHDAWKKLSKNPAAMISLFVLIAICLLCIFAPFVTKASYTYMDLAERFQGPSLEHVLGTDILGRDLLARILYGGRNTLRISFTAVLIAAVAGTLIGLISGFSGGKTDFFIMRLIDLLSSVPSFLLAVVIEAALGWGNGKFMYALAIAAIPSVARLIRASAMDIMGCEYIVASRALGVSNAGILFRHILHNLMAPLLIQLTTNLSETMLTCTILGYLQIGINPPMPEWGNLVYYGSAYFRSYPYLALIPSLAIVMFVLSVNILGNGLRDALEPGNSN